MTRARREIPVPPRRPALRPGDSDLETIIGTVAMSLPAKHSHRLPRKSKKEDLLMLFDRHCGRVRCDFYLRLQKSVNALICAVDEAIGRPWTSSRQGSRGRWSS